MTDPANKILDALAEEAIIMRPRLFAMYGLFREIKNIAEAEPYLGWGLDFGPGGGALYWDPNDRSTHHSESAEEVLHFHQCIGTARLSWLDGPTT